MKKYTFKGNDYLSKGEIEIAKFLDSLKIDFEYEFPIAVVEYNKSKLWYPDFYLKEYQIVLEYFGRYNYDDNYKGAADHKKTVFKKCGIQFVPIYHIKKNWQEYLLNSILTHQETKVKKINEVLENYNKKNGSFINRLKNFLISPNPKLKPSIKTTPRQIKSKINTKKSTETQKTLNQTFPETTKEKSKTYRKPQNTTKIPYTKKQSKK